MCYRSGEEFVTIKLNNPINMQNVDYCHMHVLMNLTMFIL